MNRLRLSVPEVNLENLVNVDSLARNLQGKLLEASLARKDQHFEGQVPHVSGNKLQYALVSAEYSPTSMTIDPGTPLLSVKFTLGVGEKETLDDAVSLFLQYENESIKVLGVSTESLVLKKEKVDLPVRPLPYDPEQLVTPLWIAYRLGADPHTSADSSPSEMAAKVFKRSSLKPVRTLPSGVKLYRTGDFIDEDFAGFVKPAGEVLTNPDVREHDSEELIGGIGVARELGVSYPTAMRFLHRSGAIPKIKRKNILYRRGDVHEALYLPGWLKESPPKLVKLPVLTSERLPAQYHPELLVSDLWIMYRLGMHPRDNKTMTEARKHIFQRESLIPRFKACHSGYYRAGNFIDGDFAGYGRPAIDVLTNPYLCEHDPEERISTLDITRELGIALKHAGKRVRKLEVEPTLHKDGVTLLYRRADVHEKLGLPGWLPKK